ncbi:hypothetical protein [Sphingobacterium daejeonense]|uniref:hypothetical protein n=1 Tax=Sphingobacterium daejeonense TaxID=371142 RepID=UPI0010FF2773|nr:hypothetical protein [Sphingobacterium daejeonense]
MDVVNAQDIHPPPVQNPPVIVEGMFSDKGLLFQAVVQKKFVSAPKFGFLAVSEAIGQWDDKEQDGYQAQGNITYELTKGFSLMGGFHMSSEISIRPALGALYVYSKEDFFIMLNPRYYIDDIGNIEGFMMGEYKPKISDKWRFYSRVQGVYCFTADGGAHNISYARARVGLGYKEFAFGVAGNFEFYGPKKINENSFGVFINVALF